MKIKSEGKTEFDRFDNVMKKVLSVSKEEMDKRIAADPRGHPKKKTEKKDRAVRRSKVIGS